MNPEREFGPVRMEPPRGVGIPSSGLKVVHDLDERAWSRFVNDHPHGNIFHTPEMFSVFANAKGHQPELWAVVAPGSQILALLVPVAVSLREGVIGQMTTRSILYGGVLCEESDRGQAALRILLEAYSKSAQDRRLFTEARNLHDVSDLQSLLQDCGYLFEDHLDYLVRLDRPLEEISRAIGRRARKRIQKALREGDIQVGEVTTAAELKQWYKALLQVYRRAKVPLADYSLFEAAFEILGPKGMVKFFLARAGGQAAACSVELIFKRTMYGWYGGATRVDDAHPANEVLTWHVLARGANQGCHLYDFGGAGRPSVRYGVRNFKSKFGGDLVNFGRNVCIHRLLLFQLSKVGYELYRRYL